MSQRVPLLALCYSPTNNNSYALSIVMLYIVPKMSLKVLWYRKFIASLINGPWQTFPKCSVPFYHCVKLFDTDVQVNFITHPSSFSLPFIC